MHIAHIVEPIKLMKNCRGKNKIIDIKFSQQIFIPSGCTIYKFSEKTQFNDGITIIKKKTRDINPTINLTEFHTNDQLSTIPLWNKYELQFIDSKMKAKRIRKSIPLQRQRIENTTTNNIFSDILPDFGIEDFLKNKITIILIACFVILLSLIIMKTMIIKFVTNWSN